jgi:hypothetical protein
MKKQTRTADKRLIMSLVHYNGLNLAEIGRRLDPPLSRASMCRLCDPDHPDKTPHRLTQIAEVLHVPEEVIFPYLPEEDTEKTTGAQHQR